MSAQPAGIRASPSGNPESLTTPKKRKHDMEKGDLKKKKRQRTQLAESPAASNLASPAETAKKQKKKRKNSSDKDKNVSQDVELPDAPLTDDKSPAAGLEEGPAAATDEEAEATEEAEEILNLLGSQDLTSFYSTRLSLYVSIPAISLEAGSASILAIHLAPLLLTYFPPAQGIVLGFSDPVLSAKPDHGINLTLIPPSNGHVASRAEVLAGTADEFGVCWVWLTATFLVFRPERGDELYGWTNVTSEGFMGLVSYNYFQTAVGKPRIPAAWRWNGPTREQIRQRKKKAKKGRLRNEDEFSQSQEDGTQEDTQDTNTSAPIGEEGGFFSDATGSKIKATLKYRVVDTEVVPAHDGHKWSLQIDGTLLDDEAEKRVLDEEQGKFERVQQRNRSQTPGGRGEVLMSGGLRLSREGSVASRLSGQAPLKHRVEY